MISHDDRYAAFEQVMKKLETMGAKLKKIPEVARRADYLMRVGFAVIAPERNSEKWPYIEYFEGAMRDGVPLEIYPLFYEDAQLNPVAEFYVRDRQKGDYGGYGPKENMIVINMSSNETPRFLAHILLHELGHALAAYQEGRIGSTVGSRSMDKRLQEEVFMWTVDYNIMLALGGRNYEKLAKSTAFKINKCRHDKANQPEERGSGVALNFCLGDLPSGKSTANRDKAFMMFCSFMAADYYEKPVKAYELKLSILRPYMLRAHEKTGKMLEEFQGYE